MKSPSVKTVIFLFTAAHAAAFLAFGGQAQKAGWKGKILTEDGVKVVVNPSEPLYGQIKLDLEEDLRIGKEGDPQTQFYRVRDIAADPQGIIYVDDMSNARIQVFDPSGAYLQTIGRSGQGPGEFEMPTSSASAPGRGIPMSWTDTGASTFSTARAFSSVRSCSKGRLGTIFPTKPTVFLSS